MLESASMAQSKVERGGCMIMTQKGNVIEMQLKCFIYSVSSTALLQMLADSFKIWYTARGDARLVRNKNLEIYMLWLLQEIVTR